VALERLPAAQGGGEPPVSNALMAALKRAQAHQRRGCPEQQQQPLLAVKVELEQLVISILDDPSVSRVMREASFSSPAVKASIEQALSNSNSITVTNSNSSGIGFRPSPSLYMNPLLQKGNNPVQNRNLYMNPLLQKQSTGQSGQPRNEEVKRVIDIMMRTTKKKNPVLVGESEPELVIKEILSKIEKKELSEELLSNVEIVSVEKELVLSKFDDLRELVENRVRVCNLVLNLGDLKWLVEGGNGVQGCTGNGNSQQIVVEMGKLVANFGDGHRIWLIGTATCETYLRCQVYHPSMENLWDLQVVPVTSRSRNPSMFPRTGANGFLSNSIHSINPLKSFSTLSTTLPKRPTENSDPTRKVTKLCSQCFDNYEKDLEKITTNESEKSSLPPWLQSAKVKTGEDQPQIGEQESIKKERIQDLEKKWSEICLRLHPNSCQNPRLERMGPMLCNPNLENTNLRETLQLNRRQLLLCQLPDLAINPSQPRSPVRTELVLGPTKITENVPQKPDNNGIGHDFLGCISSGPKAKQFDQLLNDKFADALDADSFKKLLKGLMEWAWWQPAAAAAVAATVTQCKLGNDRRRLSGAKVSGGNIWLLFTGPDRIGKKKMAAVLSNHVCGMPPVVISFGSRMSDDDAVSDFSFRGKTVLDRIVESVKQNPFSVIMLEDFDQTDMILRGNIKRAMERGRIVDSHGREISLGNVIFILTGDWSSTGKYSDRTDICRSGGCQLKVRFGEKTGKRRADWVREEERQSKGLCLDLNLTAGIEDDRTDGSLNSSDLTVDYEDDQMAIMSVPDELAASIDAAIVFKPADLVNVRLEIKKTMEKTFSTAIEEDINIPIDIEADALEKILAGVFFGKKSLQDWAEKVLTPTFRELKSRLPAVILDSSGDKFVVRLDSDEDSDDRTDGDRLPEKIRVIVNV
jgi:hypothetical protein